MASKESLPEVQRCIIAITEAGKAEARAIDSATADYEEAMGEIRAQYSAPLDDAAYRQYHAAHSVAYAARSEALNQAWRARRTADNEAWQALRSSSDPLVRFIAENCGEYQDSALEVLKLLPASLEELDALAARNDWRRVWDQFRDQAVAAGVLGGVVPPSEARRALLGWVERYMDDFGYLTRRGKQQLNELLDAVVCEEATA